MRYHAESVETSHVTGPCWLRYACACAMLPSASVVKGPSSPITSPHVLGLSVHSKSLSVPRTGRKPLSRAAAFAENVPMFSEAKAGNSLKSTAEAVPSESGRTAAAICAAPGGVRVRTTMRGASWASSTNRNSITLARLSAYALVLLQASQMDALAKRAPSAIACLQQRT